MEIKLSKLFVRVDHCQAGDSQGDRLTIELGFRVGFSSWNSSWIFDRVGQCKMQTADQR